MKKRLIAEIIQNDEVMMTIDDNLLSAEFGALDRGSLTDVVDWGIYANRGSLSFIDRVGYFNLLETKNAKVKFYLAKNTRKQMGTFNVEDVRFDRDTCQVDLDVSSQLLSLQNEKISSSVYLVANNLGNFLSYILDKSPLLYFDTAVDARDFFKYTVPIGYIQKGDTKWDAITKVCKAGMCRVSDGGAPKPFIGTEYTTPRREPIKIMPNNVLSYSNIGSIKASAYDYSITKRTRLRDGKLSESVISIDVFTLAESGTDFVLSQNSQFNVEKITTDNGNANVRISGKIQLSRPAKDVHLNFDEAIIFPSKETVPLLSNAPTASVVITKTDSGTTIDKYPDSSRSYYISELTETLENNTLYSFDFVILDAFNISESSDYLEHTETSKVALTKLNIVALCDTFEDEELTKSVTSSSEELLPSKFVELSELFQNSSAINNDSTVSLETVLISRLSDFISAPSLYMECECLVSDYYDENGDLQKSGDNLDVFNKYDIVIPYTFYKGNNVPYALNNDGTAKQFVVLGSQYQYNGHLTQKLYLREHKF